MAHTANKETRRQPHGYRLADWATTVTQVSPVSPRSICLLRLPRVRPLVRFGNRARGANPRFHRPKKRGNEHKTAPQACPVLSLPAELCSSAAPNQQPLSSFGSSPTPPDAQMRVLIWQRLRGVRASPRKVTPHEGGLAEPAGRYFLLG